MRDVTSENTSSLPSLATLLFIQMGFRLCLGLHCQADPSRVEHVHRGAPQREIYSGREAVVNCTRLNAHLRF